MAGKLAELIGVYEAHIANLADEEHSDTEALLTLLTRDSIEEARTEATQAQQVQIQRLDGMLTERYHIVAKVLPNPNFALLLSALPVIPSSHSDERRVFLCV